MFNRNKPDTAEYTRYLYYSLHHITNIFLPATTELFKKFSCAKVRFFIIVGSLDLLLGVTWEDAPR